MENSFSKTCRKTEDTTTDAGRRGNVVRVWIFTSDCLVLFKKIYKGQQLRLRMKKLKSSLRREVQWSQGSGSQMSEPSRITWRLVETD